MSTISKKYHTTLFLLALFLKTVSSFSQSSGYNPTSILVGQDSGCGIVYVPTAQVQCDPPIDPYNGGSRSCRLDIDKDGVTDLTFTDSESPGYLMGYRSSSSTISAGDSCHVCMSPTDGGLVDSLRANDVVDSNRTWGGGGTLSYSYWSMGGSSNYYGYWLKKNYIIGFKIKSGNLTYYGWVYNGGGGYAYTTLCTPSGIKNINITNQLNIYPNPAQNNFTIETSSADKQTVLIYDVNGKQVLAQTINGTTNIDAANFNAGVYNVSITSNAGITNKRLVIVK
ncbi:MAG TPA: T9SS type A sorting domain-containing protein [Bacteroidia bacterium]|nr:T9SS type A sorting domain-containing protein [Bacteroidia bacterium]